MPSLITETGTQHSWMETYSLQHYHRTEDQVEGSSYIFSGNHDFSPPVVVQRKKTKGVIVWGNLSSFFMTKGDNFLGDATGLQEKHEFKTFCS